MVVPIPEFRLELDEAPDWLSHIQISTQDGLVVLEVIKTNGLSYGEARISIPDFNDMADVLTSFKGPQS
jgi:hypothetical protein